MLITCIAVAFIVISICYNAGIIQEMILNMKLCEEIGSAEADKLALVFTTFLMIFSCITLSISTIFISETVKKETMLEDFQKRLTENERRTKLVMEYIVEVKPVELKRSHVAKHERN